MTKTDDFCDDVQSEWLLYMSETSISEIETSFSTSSDICSYWYKVSEVSDGRGGKKFAKLTYVVRAALTMSHSNAVPERGFSINNSMLGKESLSLGEKTIVSLRLVKDAVRIFGCVTKVPITRDLIVAAKKAYSEYQLHLDQKR